MNVRCDRCRSSRGSVRWAYRLNPRNWRRRRLLLCASCRTELHYTVEGSGRSAGASLILGVKRHPYAGRHP